MTRVHRLGAGFFNSYLAGGDGGRVLVDAGRDARARSFLRRVAGSRIDPRTVGLIVVTHAHYDHVRGLETLRALTGAKILVHRIEAGNLETATYRIPGGTTAVTRLEMRLLAGRAARLQWSAPVKPDIVMDGVFDLGPFGVPGRVLPTPGHSAGSVSVVLESGEAFVGDACYGIRLPFIGSVMPPFAEDLATLARSWAALLDTGARMFYPGHGRAFGRDVLARSLAGLNRRLAKSGA